MRSVFARVLATASVAVVVASCDFFGGDDSGTFTMTLADSSVHLGQGKKDTVVVTLVRSGAGKAVTLTVDGLPAGVTGVFLPNVVPGGSSSSSLELTAAGTATLDTVVLTVHASASGSAEQVGTFGLTVDLTGSYTLSSHGFPTVAAQGGGASGTVLVQRLAGHGDNVTLAATGAPVGVTATFGASPTSSIATSVSFAAAAGVAPGSYPITITGTAQGLGNQTTLVTLDVIAAPATASLSMPFCPTSVPVWFAYKNQGYPWQAVTPVSGVFTFQATATVSVAYTHVVNTQQANETDVTVLNAARTELAAQDTRDCAGAKSLTGTVSGATTGQTTRIAMGAVVTNATAASPNFSLTGVPDRALDLMATKGAISNNGFNLQLIPDLLVLQRALNPASGTSLGTLDFAGQGFAPTATQLTIANLGGGDFMNVGNTFWSNTNTYGVIHAFQPTTTVNTLYSMPAAKILAGDFHELFVETFQTGFLSGRYNIAYVGALADRTETLAPALVTPTAATISTSPYVRLRGTLTVQPEYPSAARFIFFQNGGTAADRLVYVVTTAAYLGATPATAWDIAIPDFGAVAGLNNSWMPSTSFVDFQGEAYSGPGGILFGGVPTVGDVVKAAYRVASNGSALRAGFAGSTLRAPLRRDFGPGQYLRR